MTDKELDRNAARRLAIIRHAGEVTGNVALTCRYYGISRTVFYTWLRRYQADGPAGLRDRSKRPLHSPNETPAEVVGKIIYLRTNYPFGPAKISMYLKRYHDVEISQSGVWRILQRVDLSRLPAYQRHKRADRKWKRYEKPRPGHAVQVDVKFIAPLSSSSRKKYCQFTAIDDCTRIRVLRIYGQLNQKTAIQFADYLLDKLPFRVEAIQTDNGSEFQTGAHRAEGQTPGYGCGYCHGLRVLSGFNDMATTRPDLAAELVGTDPTTITAGTTQVLMWRCRNHDEPYQLVGAQRAAGIGCGYCRGVRVLSGFNDMATTRPDLAAELVGTDPTTVIAGTEKIL